MRLESSEAGSNRASTAAFIAHRSSGFSQLTLLTIVAVFAIYWLAILGYQRVNGAAQAGFWGYTDEPSHYVSGLLVRDYLQSGFHETPLHYALRYYDHVPYFAIGYWPPLFYAVEGVWMCLFGLSRTSALALVAMIGAGCALLVFLCLRRRVGGWTACGAGFLFLLMPAVRWSEGMVMTDLLVALFSFSALMAFARFLDTPRTRWIVAFAFLAAAAIFTKNSAAFLALTVPLAILFAGRWRLLMNPRLWIAPFLIALLYAPWYSITKQYMNRGFDSRKPPVLETMAQLGALFLDNAWVLAPLVLTGVWYAFRRGRAPGLAAVCVAAPIAQFVFQTAAPVGNEPRYLIPSFPGLIVLSVLALRELAEQLPGERRRVAVAGAIALLTSLFVIRVAIDYKPTTPDPTGAVDAFAASHGYRSILVSGDAEGPMIAGISGVEPDRLSRFLVRPSKLLAHMNWTGTIYQPRYKSKEELESLFERVPLDVLLVRMNPADDAPLHEFLLRDMVEAYPDRWRLTSAFTCGGSRYAAYEPIVEPSITPGELEERIHTALGSRQEP
ncbi:MAG TPA: glycosyltransferase family 39 protein [Bryobacteraceae bacterium]|jgi:4-amino-4-deoxy-L-arabinose transferase-like glycosyltransferase|nr:glycosyltransferase family 39 protein [Bryobacteraceae bacterium]